MATFREEAVSEVISGHVSERSAQLGLHCVRYRHAAEVDLLSPVIVNKMRAALQAVRGGQNPGFAWS